MFNPILCDPHSRSLSLRISQPLAFAAHQPAARFDDDDYGGTAAMSMCQRERKKRLSNGCRARFSRLLFAFSMTLNSFLLWITKCQTCVVICIHDKILHIYGRRSIETLFTHETHCHFRA